MAEYFKDTEFDGILIKEIYENPKIEYPMITIEEIDNSESRQYTDNIGEQYSNLAYQINGYVKNTSQKPSTEMARDLMFMVNEVLGVQYKMNRMGNPTLLPLTADQNIKVISFRYNCVFDLNENRIYKN